MIMNKETIDTAFTNLLQQRAIGKKIGITANHVAQLRYKLRNGIGISTDTKMALLQKNGFRYSDKTFTQKDLVAAVKFALRQGAAAKAQGGEYLVEKFLRSK